MKRIQRVGEHGDRDERIVIYPSRTKLALLSIGALAFVATGAFFLVSGEHVIGGVLVVTFFGTCGAYLLWRLVAPRPALVIDRQGIDGNASAGGGGRIEWSQAAGFGVYTAQGQRYLGIELNDPAAYLARLSTFKRWPARINMILGFPPVMVPQSILPLSCEELLEQIEAFNRRRSGG